MSAEGESDTEEGSSSSPPILSAFALEALQQFYQRDAASASAGPVRTIAEPVTASSVVVSMPNDGSEEGSNGTALVGKNTQRTTSHEGSNKGVASSNLRFKDKDYWDERFENEDEFEWLVRFDDIRELILPLMPAASNKPRVLVVGCGNSSFSEQLYDAGYEHIVNIDFSSVVIDRMSAAHSVKRPHMSWIVMDMTNLTFDAGSFDVVIDKASMDALMVAEGDVWDPEQAVIQATDRMCLSCSKVLRSPGGRFLSVSFAQPHFRTKYLMAVRVQQHSDPIAVGLDDTSTQTEEKGCIGEPPVINLYQHETGLASRYGWDVAQPQVIETRNGAGLPYFLYICTKI
jgi:EEF1A lysine methyltransferase 4